MIDLTEKFKKHELPKGFYYAQMSNGSVEILSDYALCRYALAKDGDKIKILSAVPTYEEFNKIKETLAEHKEYCCCLQNEVLLLKIMELKELLKECLPLVSAEIMSWQIRGGEEARKRGKELLTKIEEVLE